MKRLLRKFSIRDLIMCGAMAALGLAIKPLVVPLAHIISTPLMIPGGSLAGGLYMMWLVMALGLTGKRGTPSLTGLVQAVIVMVGGINGSHGIMSLFSYTMPGVAVDIGMFIGGSRIEGPVSALIAGILANVTGTLCVNLIFFSLPLIPLLLSVTVAAVSGGTGGILAWILLNSLRKYGISTAAGGGFNKTAAADTGKEK